jgi:hypothetical protein
MKTFAVTSCAALFAAVLFGSNQFTSAAVDDLATPNDPQCNYYLSATGNRIADYEDCNGTGYVPDIANADQQSKDIAFAVFKNALKFCTQYPDHAALEAAGWWGEKGLEQGSHWRNPSPDANGSTIATTQDVIDAAAYPNAAVVGEPNARVSQLMWEGSEIAYIGTIPRVHDHQHAQKHEMLHIQCAPTMEAMFGFEQLNNIVPVEELQAALAAAETGGIQSVSTQTATASSTGPVQNPVTSSTPPLATSLPVTAPSTTVTVPNSAQVPRNPSDGTGLVTPAPWFTS